MNLSKRLEACCFYTDGFLNLADIGTDHAQLPIAAIKRGYVSKAQAIDNKHGPYVIAFANVKKWEVEDKIKVILGNGLEKIEEDTDVCVIAGMGGELISEIITSHPTKNIKRFILQPNNNSDKIRMVLPSIGFKIKDELVLEDQNKIYEVIVLEKGESVLTEEEILYGPINLKQRPFYFLKKIQQEIIQTEYVITKVTDEQEKTQLNTKLNKLKEMLK